MKPILVPVLASLLLARAWGASDADVTIIKAEKVVIEESTITIIAEARSQITLIRGAHDPEFTGDQWHGMPVTRPEVVTNKATFTIKRYTDGRLPKAWQETVQAAKDLQDGKEVGRIGFYAPDIVIKGNMLDSMTGYGYLYPKRP